MELFWARPAAGTGQGRWRGPALAWIPPFLYHQNRGRADGQCRRPQDRTHRLERGQTGQDRLLGSAGRINNGSGALVFLSRLPRAGSLLSGTETKFDSRSTVLLRLRIDICLRRFPREPRRRKLTYILNKYCALRCSCSPSMCLSSQ